MAHIVLADNGQQFTLEDDIAADDTQVVEILRESYPQLGTPTIRRETAADGTLIVTVIKRPGSKGRTSDPYTETILC